MVNISSVNFGPNPVNFRIFVSDQVCVVGLSQNSSEERGKSEESMEKDGGRRGIRTPDQLCVRQLR